ISFEAFSACNGLRVASKEGLARAGLLVGHVLPAGRAPRTAAKRSGLGLAEGRKDSHLDRCARRTPQRPSHSPQPATALTSRYSSTPKRPHSRPLPDCL